MAGRFFQKITQKQKRIILIITSILLLMLLVFCLVLPVVAKKAIEHKIAKVEQSHQVNIEADGLKITRFTIFGNARLQIENVSVCDKKADDVFFSSRNLKTEVQVWKGFRRTLILKKLLADDVKIQAVKDSNYCNFNFILHKKSSDKAAKDYDYRKIITQWLGKASDFCPNYLKLEKVSILTDIDSQSVSYVIEPFAIRNGKGSGHLVIQPADSAAESWKLQCAFDKKKQLYEGSLVRDGSSKTVGTLPFMSLFENMAVRLHEVQGCFKLVKTDKKCTHCTLSGNIRHLQCQHHYLADMPVNIDSVGGNLHLNIYAHTVEVDSTSILKLNSASLHPYIRYTTGKDKRLCVRIDEKQSDANKLFSSLPDDLFQVIPKMKITGTMDYNCLFDCDFNEIDSLKFDFNLINRGRTVHIAEGLGEITRFNDSFEYTFYDHGEPVRTLTVGPENGYFCPSYAIPDLLKQAILASEDGAFFVHNGFSKSSMQCALAEDIKAGKMRRGGSTITMQLVKNLFLNRKKVLTRKFEEMLLVWMIEDQHLISKDRMFEIYVNIIEWAPGVIGIGEAAEFYFHKKPAELTMPECIYLATLIRAPKHYAYTLQSDGSVTDVKRSELEFVADRMVIRGFMTESQRAVFDFNVKTVLSVD